MGNVHLQMYICRKKKKKYNIRVVVSLQKTRYVTVGSKVISCFGQVISNINGKYEKFLKRTLINNQSFLKCQTLKNIGI